MSQPSLIPLIQSKQLELSVLQFAQNYLFARGWNRDEISDGGGNPLPWYTYPATEYINMLLNPQWKVFEYGCGYSTLFWQAHVQQVVSIDHSMKWAEFVRQKATKAELRVRQENAPTPAAFEPILREFREQNFALPLSENVAQNIEHGLTNESFAGYAAELTTFPPGHFDVIVVDGVARVLCLFAASKLIGPEGLIILDNSDRWQYNAGLRWMASQGFARLDFSGPGPWNRFGWATSIFTRSVRALQPRLVERPAKWGDLGW